MLNIKNDKPLRAGQVFTVSLGVSGLENAEATDARAKTYALQVGRRGSSAELTLLIHTPTLMPQCCSLRSAA